MVKSPDVGVPAFRHHRRVHGRMAGAGLAVAVPRAGIPHLRRHGGIRRKSLRKARKLLGLRYNVKRKWFPPVIGNAGGALPNAASIIAQENPLRLDRRLGLSPQRVLAVLDEPHMVTHTRSRFVMPPGRPSH